MRNGRLRLHFLIFISMFLFTLQEIHPFPINFAIPSCGRGLKTLEQWSPLVEYLEEMSGLNINLIIVRDHKILKEGLSSKSYDFALLDSFWLKAWEDDSICSPFLRAEAAGTDEVRTLLVVHRDSIYRNITDLESHSIAMTISHDSTAGFYVPLAGLFSMGLDPFQSFEEIIFSETFLSILKGVAYGKLDSGFITSDLLSDPSNERYAESIRIILESPPLQENIIVVKNDFNPEILSRIKENLFLLDDSVKGRALLRHAGFSGFVDSGLEISAGLAGYFEILELNNASPE